jgi:hypothetical protein
LERKNGSDAADPVRVLAHELGNVLNGMLGVTELLRSLDPRPEQEHWLNALEQGGLQMSRLLDAYCGGPPDSGPESGIDGIELLENAILSHAPAAQASGNALLLLLPPDLPRSWKCSYRRLRQILDNLLANAIEFAPGAEIVVAARNLPGALEIDVEDAGAGLRPGAEDQLFRPFRQDLHARGPASPGSGLGLYLCRRSAFAMGGELRWLKPASGGSCFRLILPGAVTPSIRDRALTPGRLLRGIRCELHLAGNLRKSVAGLLARHGIVCIEPAAGQRFESGMKVVIKTDQPAAGKAPPELRLQLRPEDSSRLPRTRRLGLPVLETGLLEALLALVLENSETVNPRGRPG